MMPTFPKDFWKTTQTSIEFIATNTIPNDIPFTAVKIYLFNKNKILLTKVPRGWDIPTGHIEKSEDLVQAVKRETFEETGVVVNDAIFIGYMKSIKVAENEKNKKYPPISAIAIFLCRDFTMQDFNNPTHEATERCFHNITKVKEKDPGWSDLSEAILQYAFKVS